LKIGLNLQSYNQKSSVLFLGGHSVDAMQFCKVGQQYICL